MKNIYNLKLHESLILSNSDLEILRVPGGWIYIKYITAEFKNSWDEIEIINVKATSTFIPFNEFNK